jgi:starch synthase
MRVLATIIVPPHMSVSGGARAGELLSSALT